MLSKADAFVNSNWDPITKAAELIPNLLPIPGCILIYIISLIHGGALASNLNIIYVGNAAHIRSSYRNWFTLAMLMLQIGVTFTRFWLWREIAGILFTILFIHIFIFIFWPLALVIELWLTVSSMLTNIKISTEQIVARIVTSGNATTDESLERVRLEHRQVALQIENIADICSPYLLVILPVIFVNVILLTHSVIANVLVPGSLARLEPIAVNEFLNLLCNYGLLLFLSYVASSTAREVRPLSDHSTFVSFLLDI